MGGVTVRLLGEIQVAHEGTRLELPPSRKTRALLALLALSGRAHRRERLCALLWDHTGDPRGALRWSLSRLRAVVNAGGRERLLAGHDEVSLAEGSLAVDLLAVRRRLAAGPAALSTEELESVASALEREALEGLDLPDLDEYQAWVVAQRESLRGLRAGVLRELLGRLSSSPERALPHALALREIAPAEESVHAAAVRLLHAAGRPEEAMLRYESSLRLLGATEARRTGELELARLPLGAHVRPRSLRAARARRLRAARRGHVRSAVAAPEPDGFESA